MTDAPWPCGHPRTPENTQRVGTAGVRCRACRRLTASRSGRVRKQALRDAVEALSEADNALTDYIERLEAQGSQLFYGRAVLRKINHALSQLKGVLPPEPT